MRAEVWPNLKDSWLSKDDSIGHTVKEKDEKVDGRRGWKTILRRGQGWTLLAQLEQL